MTLEEFNENEKYHKHFKMTLNFLKNPKNNHHKPRVASYSRFFYIYLHYDKTYVF